jgi:hypothetical protein
MYYNNSISTDQVELSQEITLWNRISFEVIGEKG